MMWTEDCYSYAQLQGVDDTARGVGGYEIDGRGSDGVWIGGGGGCGGVAEADWT